MKNRCTTSIRHWFTNHGNVGTRTAICRDACRAVHPSVRDALLRARLYRNLYSLPDEASPADAAKYERDGKLIEEAIERISHERIAE